MRTGEELFQFVIMRPEFESRDSGVAKGRSQVDGLIDELERAIEMISRIDEVTYRRVVNGSSVGAQFRHDLDMVQTLIAGFECGRLDYGDRKRDHRIEAEPKFAAAAYRGLVNILARLESRCLGKSVLVRSEIDPETWLPSSVGREIEFVHSHTVHHHALIAEKLAAIGIEAAENFGVAPSTLEYRARLAA